MGLTSLVEHNLVRRDRMFGQKIGKLFFKATGGKLFLRFKKLILRLKMSLPDLNLCFLSAISGRRSSFEESMPYFPVPPLSLSLPLSLTRPPQSAARAAASSTPTLCQLSKTQSADATSSAICWQGSTQRQQRKHRPFRASNPFRQISTSGRQQQQQRGRPNQLSTVEVTRLGALNSWHVRRLWLTGERHLARDYSTKGKMVLLFKMILSKWEKVGIFEQDLIFWPKY